MIANCVCIIVIIDLLLIFSFYFFTSQLTFLLQINATPILLPSENLMSPIGETLNILQRFDSIFLLDNNESSTVPLEPLEISSSSSSSSSLLTVNSLFLDVNRITIEAANRLLKDVTELIARSLPIIKSRSSSNSYYSTDLCQSLVGQASGYITRMNSLLQEISYHVVTAANCLFKGYGILFNFKCTFSFRYCL